MKVDLREGVITDIAFGGDGVLKEDGFVIFVPFAAPQERVHVELTQKKRSYGFGKILHIKSPGPDRIPPRCAHFTHCGGCQFQHLHYPSQLEIKRSFVREALSRIGGMNVEVNPVIPASMQWGYRRHIRLNLKKQGKGFTCGFIGIDNHSLIEIKSCPLFVPPEDHFLESLYPFLQKLSNEGVEQGSLRLFKIDADRYSLAFSFSPIIPRNARSITLKNPQIASAIFQAPGVQESVGNTAMHFEFNGLKISYSPFGFTQNHPEQSVFLHRAILEHCGQKTQRVLDLYCGIGITSLLLARAGKTVIGIDNNPKTIELAKKNAAENALAADFFSSTVEETLSSLLQTFRPEGLILNPPRTGVSPSALTLIAEAKVKEILYVSCMPATLARDLKILTTAGYKIHLVQPFDMFPQTTHVEILVKFCLKQI